MSTGPDDNSLIIRASIRDELSNPLQDIIRRLQETDDAARRAGRGGDTGSRGLDRLGSAAARAGRNLSQGLVRGAKVGTLAVVGLGAAVATYVFKQGSAFVDTMNEFGAVTSATAAQMAAASTTAQQLGRDNSLVNVSAGDAATAMTELAKGGLSVQDAMTGAKGALELAGAAGTSAGTAADVMAQILVIFNEKGTQAAKVADQLANAANMSAASVSDMGDAVTYAGGTADALHIPFANVLTTLTAFANSGIKGSMAGTELRGMLTSLAKPTKQGQTGLKALNLELFDSQGKFKGMNTLVGGLSQAYATMTPKAFAAAAAQAFGREQLGGAIALAKEGPAAYAALGKGLDANGTAAKVAAARNQGLHGALLNVQNQAEGLATSLYLKLSPALAVGVNWLANEIPKAAGRAGTFLTAAGRTIRDVLTVLRLGGTRTGLIEALEFHGASPTAAKRIAAVLQTVWNVGRAVAHVFVNDVVPAAEAAGRAMLRAGNWVAGVLVPAIEHLWHRIDWAKIRSTIAGVFTFVWDRMKVVGRYVRDTLIPALEGIWKKIDWTKIGHIAAGAVTGIGKAMQFLYRHSNDVKLVLSVMIPLIFGYIAATKAIAAGRAAIAAVRGAWAALNLVMDANPIGVIIIAVGALVVGLVLLYRHNRRFRDIVNAVWGALKTAWQWIGKMLDRFGYWLATSPKIASALSGVKDIVNGLRDAFRDTVTWIKNAITWIGTLVTKVKNSDVGKVLGAIGGVVGKVFGDTPPHSGPAMTSGHLGHTMGVIAGAAGGGGWAVSNALIGGGGRPGLAGSGDHQAGRAVDLVGPRAQQVGARIQAQGLGRAQLHGSGEGRHMHVAVGDTPAVSRTSGGQLVTIAPGAIVVAGVSDPQAAARAVVRELQRQTRNLAERSS